LQTVYSLFLQPTWNEDLFGERRGLNVNFLRVISLVGILGFGVALYIMQRQQRIADAKSYAQLSP